MKSKSKLLWYSNSPISNSGYGKQSRYIVRGLMKNGIQTDYSLNYGFGSGTMHVEGSKVWPTGGGRNEMETIDAYQKGEYDMLFTLYDVWVLHALVDNVRKKGVVWVPYIPLDFLYLPHDLGQMLTAATHILPFTQYGLDMLKRVGFQNADRYIHHGVDTNVYQPLPNKPKDELRNYLGFKDKSFVISCFPKGTRILMKNGTEKKIEDVKKGDMVYTHKSVEKVTETFKREYEGEILDIKPMACQPFTVTPEHPLFAVKKEDVVCRYPAWQKRNMLCYPGNENRPSYNGHGGCGYCKEPTNVNWTPEWVEAKDLKAGDYLVFPIPTAKKDISRMDILKYIDFDGKVEEGDRLRWRFSKTTIPRYVEVTPTFLRLLGYFMAEGNFLYGEASNNHKKPNGLNLTFNEAETEYIDDVVASFKEIFGIECHLYNYQKSHSTMVRVSNIPLAMFFRVLCGEHAKGKRWHKDLMLLPPEKQKHLLEGHYRGDGCLTSLNQESVARTRIVSTTSEELANQVWIMLHRLRMKPRWAFQIMHALLPQGGRHSSRIWHISYDDGGGRGHDRRRWLDERYMFAPIYTITKRESTEEVFNLEVENDHSYVANKVAVHNCFKMNKGDRVKYGENLEAIKIFIANNPDLANEVGVYIHALPSTPGGQPIQHVLKSLGLESYVRYVKPYDYVCGFTEEQMAQAYNASDVILNNVSSGGFELNIIESIACGTPVIATDAMAMHELMQPILPDLLAKPKTDYWTPLASKVLQPDPELIAEKLEWVVNHDLNKRKERERLARHARRVWDWDAIVPKWVEYIKFLEEYVDKKCIHVPKRPSAYMRKQSGKEVKL